MNAEILQKIWNLIWQKYYLSFLQETEQSLHSAQETERKG